MWFENEIEGPAIRAYHNDPWTEEDYEIMGTEEADSFADDHQGGIQMRNLRRRSEQYEGGFEDK